MHAAAFGDVRIMGYLIRHDANMHASVLRNARRFRVINVETAPFQLATKRSAAVRFRPRLENRHDSMILHNSNPHATKIPKQKSKFRV